MKAKTYIIIGIAVVLVIAIIWYMRRKPASAADLWYNQPGLQVGTTKSGKKYTEQDIKDVINGIKGTPEWLASVKKGADEKGASLEDHLRANAIYTLDVLK